MNMTMFPHSVTIINSFSTNGSNQYLFTVLDGVLFENSKKALSKEYGVDSVDTMRCFIPYGDFTKPYIDEVDYNKLSNEQKGSYWTLRKGDIIIKGVVDTNEFSIKDYKSKYQDIMKINNIDFFLYGGLPHFEVGGS